MILGKWRVRFYNFDANGAPATGNARLAYNPSDIKKNKL